MDPTDLQAVVDRLTTVDLEHADRDVLADTMATSSQLRGWLDSFDLKCVRRSRLLSDAGRAESVEAMLNKHSKRSGKEAKAVADRETVAEQMAGFEDALGGGEVSSGHLDAIAAATGRLDEEARAEFAQHERELLDRAATDSVDAFTQRCRKLSRLIVAGRAKSDAEELEHQQQRSCVKRWVDKITGMHHTHLELDPIRDAKMWSVVDAQLATLRQANNARTVNSNGIDNGNNTTAADNDTSNRSTAANTAVGVMGDGSVGKVSWDQLQVEAFVGSVSRRGEDSSGGGADSGRRIPEVTVLIDFDTLVGELRDNSVCETEDGIALPASTVRRMCCDAEVLPVVLNGSGEALDVGRSKRTATRDQRRALRAMYPTCGHPGCTVGFSACRIHHIKWWWKHMGRTDLANLIPLCEKHHHLVHEGGWGLTMVAGRITEWTRPDGVLAITGKSPERYG